jgi:hypothetical protein
MFAKRTLPVVAALAALFAFASLRPASAQYSKVSTPFHSSSHSFHENIGGSWGFNLKGGKNVVGLNPDGSFTADGSIPFRFGNGGSTRPPFGGHDPNNDASLGWATQGKWGNAFFNFSAGQGSDTTFNSQTPTVVVPSGGRGAFIDATQRPFVTGLVPVVGHWSGMPVYQPAQPRTISPLTGRLQQLQAQQQLANAARQRAALRHRQPAGVRDAAVNQGLALGGGGASTAAHGDLSVAEIKRRQAAGERQADNETAHWIERARGAESSGKKNVAKIYYQMAARRAEGDQKQQLLEKLRQLSP